MASEEERESGEGPVLRRPNSHRPGEEDGRGDEAELRVSVDEEVPLLRKPTSNQGTDAGGWEGSADFDGLRWWRTPSTYWLLPPFFLYTLAFGGILVPKLNLILSLVCREYLIERSSIDPNFIFAPVIVGSDNPQCRIPEVQALVSKFTLYLTIATGMLSAVMAPKIGALSDRYGRVRFLALTSVGALLSEVVTILAATFPETISYKWLLIGAVFDGISGSSTAALSTTHAYAADCTPPPKRGVAFGYFHACLFGGIALGPLAAAAVVQFTGQLIMVFYYALAIHIFFNIFILSVVPESLSKKRQKLARERFAAEDDDIISGSYSWAGIDWLNVYRQGNILAPLKILWPTGPGSSGHLRANLILLSAVDTMIFGVAMGSLTVVVYYLGYQFGWETSQTSGFISAVSTARVAALVIALPLFIKFVRTRHANKQRRESGFATPERNSGSDNLDLYIIRFATLVEALGYLGYALARTGPVFLLSGVIASCGGVASPTLQSALTKHIPRDRVGQLLGATGLLHGLARIVCPVLFNLIYASTVGTLPQAVFVVLSGSIGLAFLLSWLIRPHVYWEEVDEDTGNPPRNQAEQDSLMGQ